jgi:hypothetical protein
VIAIQATVQQVKESIRADISFCWQRAYFWISWSCVMMFFHSMLRHLVQSGAAMFHASPVIIYCTQASSSSQYHCRKCFHVSMHTCSYSSVHWLGIYLAQILDIQGHHGCWNIQIHSWCTTSQLQQW